ncbi:MAG: ABC transporter permease [Caldisericia bacterium]|nr:ABC transporter permease [Caldisericia bacterium]
MSFKRIFILLLKEFKIGSKRFIIIWSLLAPFLISIVLSLLLGSFYIRTPRLGIYFEGESDIKNIIYETKSIITKEYKSIDSLKSNVSNGIIDIGIVIPKYFDEKLKSGEKVILKSYIFGESYARNRAIIVVTLGNIIRKLFQKDIKVNIETEEIGEKGLSIKLRVFPLIVMIAIFFGGLFIPSTSLIEEKRKKTLDALKASSLQLNEILFSKWLFGFIVSLFTGIIILIINNIFMINPLMLLVLTFLGTIMATFLGIILGIYLNDFATLLSFWKIGGIVLFFPVIQTLFPKIPEIISKIFPTYYLIKPILEIAEKGRLENSIFYILILILMNLTLFIILSLSIKRRGEFL